MQYIKRGSFAGEVNFEFWCLIKIDQGIQILQWKMIESEFLLFSLFSECFHLYLSKLTAAKSPFWCAASHYV